MKDDEPLDALLRRASHADDGPARPGGCLDPETLAAWADGTLSGVEREAAEAHTADCARCLAMVAALATTAPPASEAAGRPAWSLIRWLVPLTTAVAVTVWLVVRPAESPVPVTAPATEMAGTAKPAAAPPPVEASAERKEARRQEAPAAALKDEQVQRFAGGAQNSGVFVSPDTNVRWRVSGRTVERSADGGATWQRQHTNATADLTAGASPSRNVVWIVGRAGTVLLSVDGATWQRLGFPDATADLLSVTASSALTATVTSSAGQTYTTTDGGRTWRLQEDRPTPF